MLRAWVRIQILLLLLPLYLRRRLGHSQTEVIVQIARGERRKSNLGQESRSTELHFVILPHFASIKARG